MAGLRKPATDAEWDRTVEVLRQLWSHREAAEVRSWRDEDDYEVLGRFVETDAGERSDRDDEDGPGGERLVAVAGVSVQTVLHHERGCWIHDFVVEEAHRGEGHGRALLADLEEWARERDCEHVALACVPGNDEALAFYDAVGFERFGHVLERET